MVDLSNKVLVFGWEISRLRGEANLQEHEVLKTSFGCSDSVKLNRETILQFGFEPDLQKLSKCFEAVRNVLVFLLFWRWLLELQCLV